MNLITFYLWAFVSVLYCKFAVSSTDEEYLEKSILRSIRDKNGQFKSKFTITRTFKYAKVKKNITENYVEKFDYKLNVGEFNRGLNQKILYMNRNKTSKEIYEIYDHYKDCHSLNLRWFLAMYSWLDDSYSFSHNTTYDYTIAGPNVLMEVLLKNFEDKTGNKETFKCVDLENGKESKKCTIIYKDNIKFDYYLENKDGYTMVPSRIYKLFRNNTKSEWVLRNEYKYSEFTPVFDEESICSTKLPIGYGCSRLKEFANYYPQIDPSYGGNEFLMKQDVTFHYFTTNESDTSPCKFCKAGRINLAPLSRSYSNEMYVNQNESINIMKTIDEFANVSIKTIYNYDKDAHTVHRVNLENDKCTTFNLSPNHSTNYFYIQDLFVNRKELFYSNAFRTVEKHSYRYDIYYANFNYLGDYKVNDTDYLVFEQVIYSDELNCFDCWRNRTIDFEQNDVFENKNLIQANKIISTLYFERSAYSPESKTQKPSRIELRLLIGSKDQIGNLTIDITYLENELEAYKKYDTSKCEKYVKLGTD